MSSKFAPDVPSSLIDAVSSILGEAKVEPAKPDPEAVARKKKLDALRDKQEADKAEKGEDKPHGVRKVAGTAYGGSKQKDDPEQQDEELKGNQHKIDANKNGKIDADDFKKLRAGKKDEGCGCNEETDQVDEAAYSAKAARAGKDIGKPGKNFAKIAAKAGKHYGSAEKGKKVAGAILAKIRAKHEQVEHLDEKSTSEKQARTMAAAAHNPSFAKKVGIPVNVAKEFNKADKGTKQLSNAMKKEEVQINEVGTKGMGAVYTTMMDLADKKGYKNHKQFTKSDYETIGKEHGVSGGTVAIVSGHHTADSYHKLKEGVEKQGKIISSYVGKNAGKKDLPFTPDKPHGPIAKAGKYGYGPSAAKHLAHLGQKGLHKEETVEEGTGGPIYTKPLVKLGDLLARAKDMKNIKKATIVTPKDENEVKIKKEEVEQVDETMMGKAGCTSEDDKKKAEKPVDYDKPTFLRKKDDWRKSNPAHLPKPKTEEVVSEGSEDHFTNIPSDVKKKMKAHIEKGDFNSAEKEAHKSGHLLKYHHLVRSAAHSFHQDYDTRHHDIHDLKPYMSDYLTEQQIQEIGDTKDGKERLVKYIKKASNPSYEKSNVNLSSRAASKLAADDGKDDGEKDDRKAYMRSKGIQRAADRLNKEEVEQIDELSPALLQRYDDAVDKKHTVREPSDPNNKYSGTSTTRYPNSRIATNRITGAIRSSKRQAGFKGATDKVSRAAHYKAIRGEEVELDETATLDKYIRSMGYDPKHLDKNRKVMFSKTNAYKTFAMSQEALYDGGQKGTQDIDDHMSPGATARG